MSLINQMLRDLEERRATATEPRNLQREIRPLPKAATTPRWPWAVALATLGGMGGAYWLLQPSVNVFPSVQRPAVVSPHPPTATVPPLPAAAVLPPPTETVEGNESLRLAVALKETPPELPAPVGAPSAGDRLPTAQEAAPVSTASKQAALPKEVPVVPKVPLVEGVIEKTVPTVTPRDRAEGEFRRAQAALAGGQVDEGADLLAAVLRLDPAHIPARQALIRTYLESHRQDAAETALREGLEVLPAQIGWATSLARLQVERNDLAAAQATLVRHAVQGSRSPDYLGFLGHIQHRLGRYPDAVASYQGAIRISPSDGRWWLGLGLAQEADGHGSEARESFRRALATGNLALELTAVAEQRLR